MLDDADRSVQLALQVVGIVDRSKRTVQDVMAVIGDKRLSLACRSSHQTRAEPLQPPRGRVPRERHDFYRHDTTAETIDELGLVDDDDQLLAAAGDDLFTQQRAAATFQKVEPADIDFVCAIDCDVNVIMLR